MKSHIFLAALATVVAMTTAEGGYGAGGGQVGGGGQGGGGGRFIPIVKDDRSQTPYGDNKFEFEAANGIVRWESGKEKDGHVQEGGWRYTSPEGYPVEITFVADYGGFHPQGDVLPVAPPLPYQRTQTFGGSGSGGYA